MFTGLIADIGTITAATVQAGGVRLSIASHFPDILLGESIACNGACLTVVAIDGGTFDVELSPETLARTEKSYWQRGSTLNLERALNVGDRLGGHFVTGHVDGVAELLTLQEDGGCFALTLRAPAALSKYIATKGSVTLNGISLTVNRVEGDDFDVMIIPHTWAHTTLHTLQPHARLHLEIDLLARYVERLQG